MAGSPQRDTASKIPVIVSVSGRAVAAIPAPDQCVERNRPGTLDDIPCEQNCPEQVLIQSLVGELNDQGQDQHRQSGKPRRKSEHQWRRADDLDRFPEPCRGHRVQPGNRVLVRREIERRGPALQLDHARGPEDPAKP